MTVADVMTRKVISVSPETPLLDAAKLLTENIFDGVPVVTKENRLVGILTEYDLIHFIQPIVDAPGFIEGNKSKLTALAVGDAMNTEPLTIGTDVPISHVIVLFRDHHRVDPIPVVDENKVVVGIITRYDIIKLLRRIR